MLTINYRAITTTDLNYVYDAATSNRLRMFTDDVPYLKMRDSWQKHRVFELHMYTFAYLTERLFSGDYAAIQYGD